MILPNKLGVALLSIRTLGGLAIWLDDVEVEPPAPGMAVRGASSQTIALETRTTEALLVYLACLGRPVARDILAELLWPERTQEQARANLSVALHRLRRQLAPYFLVTRQSVAFNPDARIELDAAQFEACLAAGRLAAATACYAGDFLDGFALRDNPAFEHWALLERERLRTLAIAAYQQLSVQRAAAGDANAAIAGAQRLLQLDPFHEPTHRQLMRLLAQTGQRSAALAQYESCRQLLTAELEVPPDETTTALYEQIRAGELDRTTPTQDFERWQAHKLNSAAPYPLIQPSGQPGTPSPLHTLPPQPTPFIGRSAELAQLENRLANPDCRLLTLLGPGGIGKTRLAIAAATRQASNFADGVCFVVLAAVESAELLLLAVAQSLGLQSTSSDLQGVADLAHSQVHDAIGGPMRALADAALATVRMAMAPDHFAAAWTDGRALSVQEAISLTLVAPPVDIGGEVSTPSPLLPPSPGPVAGSLSIREVEVLRLLAAGMSYKQIAEQLIISPRTVNRHLTTIYTKLNVTSRHGAARFARDHHLV